MWAGTLLCVPDSLFYEWFSSQPGVIVYFSKSLNYWFTWQPLKPESDLFKNKHNIRLAQRLFGQYLCLWECGCSSITLYQSSLPSVLCFKQFIVSVWCLYFWDIFTGFHYQYISLHIIVYTTISSNNEICQAQNLMHAWDEAISVALPDSS